MGRLRQVFREWFEATFARVWRMFVHLSRANLKELWAS